MFLEIILIILIIFVLLKWKKDTEGLPPGDWTWPLIGKLLLTSYDRASFIKEQKKKHGSIFRSQAGIRKFVYLTDYDTIKSVLSKTESTGRPDFNSFESFNLNHLNKGIAFTSKEVWQTNRRFALKHLHSLGMGKKSFEGTIMREADALIEYLEEEGGKPIEIDSQINVAALNIIWGITADRRYNIKDSEMYRFTAMVDYFLNVTEGPYALLDIFPVLKHILPNFIQNKYMKVNEIQIAIRDLTTFFKEIVDEHKKTYDSNDCRDFIDLYLKHLEEDDVDQQSFERDEANLIITIWDLFAAGSDTTAKTTRWFILYMATYPQIQATIQKELDEVITDNRLPSMADKDKLPYLEATIMEVNRKASIAPTAIPHCTTSDMTIGQYNIPKNTVIIPCIEECHNDPKYWKFPDKFYPEHFIEDGKVIKKKAGYVPFSVGKRVCLGESLAKMEVFLFASSMLKKFNIKAPDGEELSLEPIRSQIMRIPKPFKIVMEKRH